MNNKKKLKILRIITRLNVGGPSKHVIYLSEGLNKYNCETLLVSGKPDKNEGNMYELASNKNIELKIIKCLKRSISPINDLMSFLQIIKIIKEFSPDIVHTHTTKAGILGRFASLIFNVPFVYHTYHGHVFKGYFSGFITCLIVAIERFFSKFTTKLITLTPNLTMELNRFLKLKSIDKITAIPLGLDLNKNLITPRKNNKWREKAGFSENVFLLGIVGRLVPIKNHYLLINSMKKICDNLSCIHLVIIGDGELRNELEKYVKSIGLESKIHFYGVIKNLQDIYSDLDLLVLCSKNEGTPVALIEALASGCPVASTKVGGVEELLEGGRIGRLLSSDTNGFQKDLSEAIIDIMNNNYNEYPTLEIRKHICELYSLDRLVKNIYKLYSE